MNTPRWNSFDVSALYYDLLRAGHDEPTVAPHLVRPGDVVVDVGTGSGRLAVLLTRTASAVYALEPNQNMRALTLSHLARHPEALEIVTVLPLAAEDDWAQIGSAFPPPATVDVVLMLGVIHMLEPSGRRAAFRNAARSLGADGLLAITGVTNDARPIDIALGRVRLGALTITGRLRTEQEPNGWRTIVDYVTLNGDDVLWTETVDYVSEAPDLDTIERELNTVGLHTVWSGTLDDQNTLVATSGRPWQPAGQDAPR